VIRLSAKSSQQICLFRIANPYITIGWDRRSHQSVPFFALFIKNISVRTGRIGKIADYPEFVKHLYFIKEKKQADRLAFNKL